MQPQLLHVSLTVYLILLDRVEQVENCEKGDSLLQQPYDFDRTRVVVLLLEKGQLVFQGLQVQDFVSNGHSESDIVLSPSIVESLKIVELRFLLLHTVV